MKITFKFFLCLMFCVAYIGMPSAKNKVSEVQKITVQIELSSFGYLSNNPYLALWLSRESARGEYEHKALVVLRDKVKWLRDLKQFWRKIARENRSESDAVTGATARNKKLKYQFDVESTWQKISLEVVREDGNRELIFLPIPLGEKCIEGKLEITRLCLN